MSGFSRTMQLAIANWLRGTAMPTAPTGLFLALSTSPINDDGTGFVEPTAGYSRIPITLTVPVHTEGSGTVVRNAAGAVFGPATALWNAVVAVAVLDQSGNILLKGNLTAPKVAAAGDALPFGVGTLEFNVR
jgi:hypothetical protein